MFKRSEATPTCVAGGGAASDGTSCDSDGDAKKELAHELSLEFMLPLVPKPPARPAEAKEAAAVDAAAPEQHRHLPLPAQPLYVVSWNAGGFAKTHEFIQAHYGSFATYLTRMGVDIFCVQETKVLPNALQSKAAATGLGAVLDGYMSFWAFNRIKGKTSGLNGVAVWLKEDVALTSGARATQEVLRHPLDQEGRCLLVDLGGIAIINVYAPRVDFEALEQQREAVLTKKMLFLRLLDQRVAELEESGKRVLVCGDLNLTCRPADCRIARRRVEVVGGHAAGRKEWPVAAQEGAWVPVADVAKSLSVTCTAPAEHMVARLPLLSGGLVTTDGFTIGGKEVSIGRSLLKVDGVDVFNHDQAELRFRQGATVSLEFGVRDTDIGALGQPAHYHVERKCVESLRSMLSPTGILVDTFAHIHPSAVNRFTCWNQMMNLRYSNNGTRLDYILCDARTAEDLVATPTSDLVGATAKHAGHTGEAAHNAATHCGRWEPAPRRALADGSCPGLSWQEGDMELNNSQFYVPHTGMLYTPPCYSDHVPVCALFRDRGFLRGTLLVDEKDTRKCTPWVSQPGLASFFGRSAKRAHSETS